MALDKAIEHGKEKRRVWRDSRRVDPWCRNHDGRCVTCARSRKRRQRRDQLIEHDERQLAEGAGRNE